MLPDLHNSFSDLGAKNNGDGVCKWIFSEFPYQREGHFAWPHIKFSTLVFKIQFK